MKSISLFYLIVCLFCLSVAGNAQPSPTRSLEDYVWDLSLIYESRDAWEQDRKHALEKLSIIPRLEKEKIDSSSVLAEVLHEMTSIRSLASKVSLYAILQFEENSRAKRSIEMRNLAEDLVVTIESEMTGIEQRIQQLDQAKLQRWLNNDSNLSPYAVRINRIIAEKPYTLSPDAQSLIRRLDKWPQISIDTYWTLNSANIWPSYTTADGDELSVNRSTFRGVRRSENRVERDSIAAVYQRALLNYSDIFATLYTGKIEAENIIARSRNLNDGIEAAWLLENTMPSETYQTMFEVIRKNMGTLHRYSELRARVLGVDQLSYLDFYLYPESETDYDVSQTMEIAQKVAAEVGQGYATKMNTILLKPLFYLAPNPDRGTTYHIHPSIGDGHYPYLYLAYQPVHLYSRALVGGLFSANSSMWLFDEPLLDTVEGQNAGVFGNGVIYVGDMLYDDYKIRHAKNDQQKIYHLLEALELLRGHFYKHLILMDLDMQVQQQILNGTKPSGKEISDLYLKLIRKYYGHEQGYIDIPDFFAGDWMTETHVSFMPSYEHQYWPAAVAAAAEIVEQIRENTLDETVMRNSVQWNEYNSYFLLKRGGIDMASEDPYQAVVNRMNRLMDELEKLIDG